MAANRILVKIANIKSISSKYVLVWLRIAACVWISASSNLFAQPILSVEEAVVLALQNNYDIQLSRYDSTAAALDYDYRNAVFLPRLNATVGTVWNRNSQKQEFISGEDRSGNVATNNLSASINLNWTLFDGFKMFVSREKAAEFIRLGELVIREQVSNTIAEVMAVYYDLVRQKQQLRAIEEQMSISQTRVDLAQRKLEIGVSAKPELLQSQVDLNAQKAAQLLQHTYILQRRVALEQMIRPGPTNEQSVPAYEVTDTIPVIADLTLEEVLAQVEARNPSLLIARQQLTLSELALDERKAERLPTVQFNSAYNFIRVNNNIALNPVLPLINRNSGFNYGFTATIPILNYRNTHRLIRQEELNIGFQRMYIANQQSLLRLGVRTAFQEFENQKEILALEEENILLAKENVDIILETYRLGHTTYLQLREAQKSLEDAYNRLIAARYNTKVAEVELGRLMGSW
jgi:outer membrane protein TolC